MSSALYLLMALTGTSPLLRSGVSYESRGDHSIDNDSMGFFKMHDFSRTMIAGKVGLKKLRGFQHKKNEIETIICLNDELLPHLGVSPPPGGLTNQINTAAAK